MKYLKSYNELITEGKDKSKKKSKDEKKSKEKKDESSKLIKKIKEVCKKFGFSDFTVEDDGTVNVVGNVYINDKENKGLYKDGRLKIKFGRIDGDFGIGNLKIDSFEGFPHTVNGSFILSSTLGHSDLVGIPQNIQDIRLNTCKSLTSLKGVPKQVSGEFHLRNCGEISSLEGLPQTIGTGLLIQYCKIESLVGCPETINGDFIVNNTNLTSLEGGPKYVGEDFGCPDNKLQNLIGGPILVGRNYNCVGNQLTSLEGAPQRLSLNFDIQYNWLENLIGCPEEVGEIEMNENPLTSLEGFPKVVDGDVYFGHCENLYNPKGIRDSQIGGWVNFDWETPICKLMAVFCDVDHDHTEYREIKKFQDSLDYNYLKEIDGVWYIIYHRFKEACEEFEIDFDYGDFNDYSFIDDEGNVMTPMPSEKDEEGDEDDQEEDEDYDSWEDDEDDQEDF